MSEHNRLIVTADGTAHWGDKKWRSALGRSVSDNHVEGDGASPVGAWPLRRLLYRADRLEAPQSFLAAEALTPEMLWSDDPNDAPNYNRQVTAPYDGSHEFLWREDGVYDIIVPLGYNDDPVIPDRGSAIFLHIAREHYTPTDGCVALALEDLLIFLAEADADTVVEIRA